MMQVGFFLVFLSVCRFNFSSQPNTAVIGDPESLTGAARMKERDENREGEKKNAWAEVREQERLGGERTEWEES